MHEQQAVKIEELAEGVVSGADRLRSLLATYTNADMSFHDHRHIIGTISNRQSDPLAIFLTESDHISFLLGRDAAADNRRGEKAQAEEFHTEGFRGKHN